MANTKVKAEQLEAAQTNITSVGTLTGLTGGTGDLIWDTPTFVVDSSANKVGIGTNSPSYSLTVEKAVTGDWLSRIYNTGTAEGDMGVLIRTGSEHDGTSILSLYSGSSYKFKFQADGKLGIATTSPNEYLHVHESATPRKKILQSGMTGL